MKYIAILTFIFLFFGCSEVQEDEFLVCTCEQKQVIIKEINDSLKVNVLVTHEQLMAMSRKYCGHKAIKYKQWKNKIEPITNLDSCEEIIWINP